MTTDGKIINPQTHLEVWTSTWHDNSALILSLASVITVTMLSQLMKPFLTSFVNNEQSFSFELSEKYEIIIETQYFSLKMMAADWVRVDETGQEPRNRAIIRRNWLDWFLNPTF